MFWSCFPRLWYLGEVPSPHPMAASARGPKLPGGWQGDDNPVSSVQTQEINYRHNVPVNILSDAQVPLSSKSFLNTMHSTLTITLWGDMQTAGLDPFYRRRHTCRRGGLLFAI